MPRAFAIPVTKSSTGNLRSKNASDANGKWPFTQKASALAATTPYSI